MGFKEIKVQEEVSANLVPMIDIMFLLLLFFMLNADMSQRELEEVTTPVANQAQEVDKESTENDDRIMLNIFYAKESEDGAPVGGVVEWPLWKISLQGQHYQPLAEPDASSGGRPRPIEPELKRLETALRELATARKDYLEDPNNAKSPSKRGLLIRADQGAPWGAIQRALERASMAGLYRTEVAVQIEKAAAKERAAQGK